MSSSTLNLPHCFLADLPPEAELTPSLLFEAWLSLQRNREQHLAGMNTQRLIRNIESAAALWLEDGSPFMKRALDQGPREMGFPPQTIADGLRSLFQSLTSSHLESWIEQDLGHLNRLDDFCAVGAERAGRRRSKASGFDTLAHITAGNVPAAAVMSLVAGLLVRSAQFVRCGTGASLIPRLFAHSLREISAPLGSCIEIAAWPHQRQELLQALIESAECVTATGSDEAVTAIRNEVPFCKRFVGYGHKVSFAYLSADALVPDQLAHLARAVARDVCAWNQLGCLSPQVVYVEEPGAVSAEAFAEELATALATFEAERPRGPISKEEAGAIRSLRSFCEVRAANLPDTHVWQSRDSTAWTVVQDNDPQFQGSCLNRFVFVKGVGGLEAVLHGADPLRRHVSTVALAGSAATLSELAGRLARWGVSRVCPIGHMQEPPATWRHDGRPALNELVRWTDWEE